MTTEALTTMYDKISDPMQAIEKMGEWISKSGLFGCEKLEQGMVLAMESYSSRRPITDICRRYHIMDGKLSMKAEAMLAEFNAQGGQHFWEKSDDKEAVLTLTKGQFKNFRVTYTMQDAERAGLCGKGGTMRTGQKGPGGWQKNPEALLRARCVSKGIRMVDPGVVVGVYTPEEVEDMRPTVNVSSSALFTSTAAAPAITEAKILPASVDTPANTEAVEAEKPELLKEDSPEDLQRKELRELVADIGDDAMDWLLTKGWLGKDGMLTDLPLSKVQEILTHKTQFKQAVKTFRESKKEKANGK